MQLAQSQEYPGWFQQRYAVLIVKLDEVNRRLEPALVRLHASRSSPPSHTPTIGTFYFIFFKFIYYYILLLFNFF